MKRYILLMAVFVLICFLFNFTALTIQGDEEDEFEVKADGKVLVGGLEFKNISEYLKSKYFKQMGKRCGTNVRFKKGPLASPGDCTLSRTVIQNEYWPAQTYTIPIVFHIIHKADGIGNISDQRIYDQIDILNEDYRAISGTLGELGFDTKIQFQLAGITRTANNQWHQDKQEYQYKQVLGWDQARYLNVYVNTAGGYLGYSTLPQEDAGNVYDGVVVLYEVVGGRDVAGAAPYDQGRTLVHEVGHYLGLLHTFEGYACYTGYYAGDLIADTHSENDEHYGCTQTYSCGTPDDIQNYMNYTDDTCMEEFTSEQANRLICSLVNYRPLLATTAASITVTSPNGGETWASGSIHNITWTSTGTVGNVKIEYSSNNNSSWSTITSSTANDGTHSWTVPNVSSTQCLVRIREASDGSPSDTSDAVFSITSEGGSVSIALNRTRMNFTAVVSGSRTGSQSIWVSSSGSGTLNWSANSNASWLICTPTSGTGFGKVTVSINPAGLAAGSYTGTITVTAPNAVNSPQSVIVYLTVKYAYEDEPPFGVFSTPVSGSTVRSSVPITGWALDDVKIVSVKIYNGNSYVGDAVFVEGARPDVEQAYPNYPKNYQAGWGYMMLSNFLPNGGNGFYTLYARAIDSGGNQVTLGTKNIYCNNANAVKPFGAIDTPTQGGTASGSSFVNWGWVLTPQPNRIPTNGSTINVFVDSVNIGHPTYNLYRSDIAGLFPGYANSNGAAGYFYLDTTAYENGVHTIYWTAADNAGNTDGIGSRYFTIFNSGVSSVASGQNSGVSGQGSVVSDELLRLPVSDSPVGIIKGFNRNVKPLKSYPNDNGIITIEINELECIKLYIDNNSTQVEEKGSNNSKFKIQNSKFYSGYQLVGSQLKRLPIGSTLDRDKGIFYWNPGPGFVGSYELLFIDGKTGRLRRVNIKILPKY